ncbi:MAG: DUF1822 family protein [Merismopedia sp. SIO2A8]|nr:DUF1822 family protein [Symploca sp. SIO2B6]NET51114.1 DUF1822 family protein [Merismopedia sp. SIO2A8]
MNYPTSPSNTSTNDLTTFSVPLPLAIHGIAQTFYQSHLEYVEQEKPKQVYLNTLAVYAVHTYLKYLKIETLLETSDSWNPVMQGLSDIADLVLAQGGRLECRPVLPKALSCNVPPEVWSDRVGYVAVQFDPSLHYAHLLGFLPTVAATEVPLEEWRSLELLIGCLSNNGVKNFAC